jgi:DNA polymerase III subunit chi
LIQAVQVRFYACDGDPVRVALKLLVKAWHAGQAVRVEGAPAQLQQLSESLWLQNGFMAHAGPKSSPATQLRSALRLGVGQSAALCINLQDETPAPLGAERVFEMVGSSTEAREGGRSRFRHYRALGVTPETVQVGPQ